MDWCWRGNKPLSEPMITQVNVVYYRCGCDGENVAFIEGKVFWVIAIKSVQCHNLCSNRPFHLKRNMKNYIIFVEVKSNCIFREDYIDYTVFFY